MVTKQTDFLSRKAGDRLGRDVTGAQVALGEDLSYDIYHS